MFYVDLEIDLTGRDREVGIWDADMQPSAKLGEFGHARRLIVAISPNTR